MENTRKSTRVFYTCRRKGCGNTVVINAEVEKCGKDVTFYVGMVRGIPFRYCDCGHAMNAKPLAAVTSHHPCDARCTGATGHSCECSCGGQHHGTDNAA